MGSVRVRVEVCKDERKNNTNCGHRIDSNKILGEYTIIHRIPMESLRKHLLNVSFPFLAH